MKLITEEKLKELSARKNQPQPLDSARLTEPRIELVQARLRELLKVVQLESDGRPVDVDGFRLRDPGQWVSRVAPPLTELWHISTACNMRCPFCYEEGDPEEGSVLNEPAEMVSLKEIETRLKYRDARKGTGVFQPVTYINEMFCNPQAMEILERLRAEQPDDVLTFVTNGTYLTEDMVARLAKLKPVFFNFSVNSLDPDVRTKILRDLEPETAIASLELLRKYEIPYLGSLVCWPSIPWSDIENTCRVLDAAGCAVIRFSLSAYSKHMKGKRFDRKEFWDKGVAVAQRLAEELDTPIKIEPYHYIDASYKPNVAGVLKGSPAYQAGIRVGDRILEVEGHSIHTVNQALGQLAVAANRGSRCSLRWWSAQDGGHHSADLDEESGPFGYPYDSMIGFQGMEWGLLMVENLKFSYFKDLREIIDRHGAQKVLICSSELMRPIVEDMLVQSKAFDEYEIVIEVPENGFFGGTVVLGDLLVVDDYVHFLNHWDEQVDLVVIPSSPFSRGEWKRDLAGVNYKEIARRTGRNVELLECRPLNG